MRQGIDITDVESVTKIRAKFLRSLENEEWALVGDDTLVRSFLRTYAEHLGLDPTAISEEFSLSRMPLEPHGTQRVIGRDRLGEPSHGSGKWLAVGALVVVAVLLVVIGGGR